MSDLHAAILGQLQAGYSAAINVCADSTSNGVPSDTGGAEWVYQLGQKIGAALPNIRIEHKVWDSTNSRMGPWTVLQAGLAGERYAQFNTGGNNRAWRFTKDEITSPAGDLDARIRIAADNWNSPAATQTILARQGGSGNRGWLWNLSSAGTISFSWYAAPTDASPKNTLAVTRANIQSALGSFLVDGQAYWLRVALDLDNGAGGYDCTMYISTTDDAATSWVQVGQLHLTTGGATTLADPDATCPYEIGARSVNVDNFGGKVYKVEIQDGIEGAGFVINPEPIDAWEAANNAGALGGSPTLFILNGSRVSANLQTFNAAPTFKQLVRNFRPCMTYLSTGHNEGVVRGQALSTALDTWFTSQKARQPWAGVTIVLQNPERAPAVFNNHHGRMAELAGWAARNGLPILNAYKAFALGGDLSLLVDTDGVHPLPPGNALWAQTAYEPFSKRINR